MANSNVEVVLQSLVHGWDDYVWKIHYQRRNPDSREKQIDIFLLVNNPIDTFLKKSFPFNESKLWIDFQKINMSINSFLLVSVKKVPFWKNHCRWVSPNSRKDADQGERMSIEFVLPSWRIHCQIRNLSSG